MKIYMVAYVKLADSWSVSHSADVAPTIMLINTLIHLKHIPVIYSKEMINPSVHCQLRIYARYDIPIKLKRTFRLKKIQ